MFYQTDSKFKNEIMTHPAGQKNADLIGDYGCLVTCYCNILFLRGEDLNPKSLNEIIKQYKGYAYLFDPTTPSSKASFLRTEILENLYNFKKTIYTSKDLNYQINAYYIAKINVIANGITYTHFINILEDLKSSFYCYDVYDGKQVKIDKNKVIDIYKIEFSI